MNSKKTVGFPISKKENEKRRVAIPQSLTSVKNIECLYFEHNYGEVLGIDDDAYSSLGCKIVSESEVLKQDIICDAKIGDAEYINELHEGQTVFGWVHAVRNRDITDVLIENKLTAYAWEDMFEEGRHCFWRNNEIAGEAAIMHAFQCYGIMPYNTKVALLGRGNVARGALKILTLLGAEVMVYGEKAEKLFQKELPEYDVVVNGIIWDARRNDHIIYEKDLTRMKRNAMIIDISCDRHGGIETSQATTIENPIYKVQGIAHYAVDHTPSLFYKTTTASISKVVVKYIDELIENNLGNVMKKALIVDNGVVIDERINQLYNR
ncbi:MAG: N(5)-(carboxyethyl)ornithine synthase [Clostridia bacterium]|nr:N(5)-(carboxyethyl)ornithine synthase [Clostridia bacterium]MDD4048180.1 N(5)-(carboxyethyl)ornithine synthase [Clostridia bacterium]